MNERIRELKNQTLDRHFSYTWTTMDYDDVSRFAEKFAELIVRECMAQVRDQYLPVLEDKEMMKDKQWDGYVQCGVDSYVAIKETFGIKE